MLTTTATTAAEPDPQSIRKQASRVLRRFWIWGQIRRVQDEGVARARVRHQVWARVLSTPPVRTIAFDRPAPYELHLVCHFADYLSAIWGLKSYLGRVGGDAHLYIHVQGRHTTWMARRLQQHFPDARLMTQAAADAAVVPELRRRGLRRLEALRAMSAVMLKLVDVALTGTSDRLLVLDGDVLFFRRPDALHDALLGPGPLSLFQRDAFTCYVISPQQARDQFHIALEERINTGIVALDRRVIDLALCEQLLEGAVLAGGWVEQTLYALAASAAGHVRWLPETYALSMSADPAPDGLVSRHYSGPSRAYMTRDAMPWLIAHGLTDAGNRPLG